MNNIKSQLKRLKAIEPDRDFVIRAKYAFISSMQPTHNTVHALPRFANIRAMSWAWTGAGLTIALLLAVVAIPFAFPKPSLSASLSPDTLISEYGNLPINIQLKEITYGQDVNQTISSAITEVSDTKTKHLNSDVISSEAKNASIEDPSVKNVDSLLNQVIN